MVAILSKLPGGRQGGVVELLEAVAQLQNNADVFVEDVHDGAVFVEGRLGELVGFDDAVADHLADDGVEESALHGVEVGGVQQFLEVRFDGGCVHPDDFAQEEAEFGLVGVGEFGGAVDVGVEE